MNFDIKEPRKGHKHKKKEDKLLYLALFFLILSITLIVIQVSIPSKKNFPKKQSTENVEKPKEKLKIIDEESNERPIAIMIDNNVGNNLHAGLQYSYINYEIIVEGGLTRIMALYKDREVSLIGPVRSSRHYFLDYALESDSIYTHFGWSPYAERDIKALNINNINGLTDSTPFWRDSNISAPHNVFTSTDKIRNYSTKKNYSNTTSNWKLLNYSTTNINLNEVDSSNVFLANKIDITYSNYQQRGYTYDSVNQYYLRSMNGKAHLDKETQNQLNFKNIIIAKVNNYNLDSAGRQDLTTIGSGTGYYITNGYALPINWTKSSRSAKTIYTYSNGSEINVNDGNTFIQIVPLTSNITIE